MVEIVEITDDKADEEVALSLDVDRTWRSLKSEDEAAHNSAMRKLSIFRAVPTISLAPTPSPVRRNADAPHEVVVEHRRPGRREEWVENYRVDLRRSLSAEEAEAVRQRHRTDPHFGHLLHSLRLNKWAREGRSSSEYILEPASHLALASHNYSDVR